MSKVNKEIFCNNIMDRYKRFSLENAEIRVLEEESISFKTRNLKLENIERSESTQIVINAFKDNKQATITTNNIDNHSYNWTYTYKLLTIDFNIIIIIMTKIMIVSTQRFFLRHWNYS